MISYMILGYMIISCMISYFLYVPLTYEKEAWTMILCTLSSHIWNIIVDITYDIMYDIRHKIWYHVSYWVISWWSLWYHIYMMLCKIVFQKTRYHIWYHTCLISYLICLCMISYMMCLIDSHIIYDADRLASSQTCPRGCTSRTTKCFVQWWWCASASVAWVSDSAESIRFWAGCRPNWQRGWVKILGRNCVYPQARPWMDCGGVECHPRKQPGP